MTDIQKVIKFAKNEVKSLELAPKINGCEMTEWWKEQIEVWETAISALEKQIPKKPLKKSIEYDGEYGYCPCCNHVAAGYDSNNVCRHCGQALDWSDTE